MSSDPGIQPFQTSVKSWEDLRREFKDSKEEIMALRLETEKEGKKRAKREALGRATRRDNEDLSVVRFSSEQDVSGIGDYLWAAREAIPVLEVMFSAEVPTLEFLVTWGAFQLSYGLAMGSCFRSGDAFDTFRKSIRASAENQVAATAKRNFVAVLLKEKMDAGGTGKTIYYDVAVQLSNYIKEGRFPKGFDEKWFRSLLDPTLKKLRAAYNERHLSKRKIEALAALPRGDIPSI